jgi:hypothetical protein
MANEHPKKIPVVLECKSCDYYTSSKKDYDKHLFTSKHKRLTNTNGFTNENPKKSHDDTNFLCKCGKLYKHMSSLCKHKKNCNIQKENTEYTEKNKKIDDNLIVMLVNQCKELRDENKELMEIIKNGTHNTNSHNTNSLNKTFNLQFFLNETCKDAMNITDFINSIQLQLSDLEKVGKIGYVEGISNIITTNLKALDVTQRPIHCTDNKRETLYVKSENKWEKENEEKNKLRKVIKHIAHKNSKMLPKFKEKYPDCVKSESKYSDQYNKLVVESFGGSGDNDTEKENKIIKNIAKEVVIEK